VFYQNDPSAQRIGEALVAAAGEGMAKAGLASTDFSLTLLLHPDAEKRSSAPPRGFAYRGATSYYPCSVVKLFLVVAARQALDEGRLTAHEELSRAMQDMIRWSSNTATNYVIDLLSGTTGDTLLDDAAMREWVVARSNINLYYQRLEPELCADINLSQKLMDDDRYGREKMFVRWQGQNNHNRLTSNAAAWLMAQVMCGDLMPAESAESIAKMLHRPIDDAEFVAVPTSQIVGYLGGNLTAGATLWSKAGRTLWTGDALASYRRHDLAHVKLDGGARFTLAVFTQGQAVALDDRFLPGIGRMACELIGAGADH